MESLHLRRGFTLIELLVVVAIMVVILSIVLTSQSSFNKTLILTNTAYDVALTIRSAETFGIASRASGLATNAGYGVHFQSGTANSFIFFPDVSPAGSPGTLNCPASSSIGAPDCKPGDALYTANADTPIQTYTLGNGIIISDFCAGSSCASTGLASLDIVFSRPNPAPRVNGSSGSACLKIVSPQGGSSRFVSIGASGVINANAPSCP